MASTPEPVLTDIAVQGLFGHFDHHIAFPSDWDFVIIHGVNGVGKTKVLDLIKSAMVGNLGRLARIPFQSAVLTFSDRSTLELSRKIRPGETADGVRDDIHNRTDVHLSLKRSGRKPVQMTAQGGWLQLDARTRDQFERYTPLVQIEDDTFLDQSSGETISTAEAIEHYGPMIPISRFRGEPGPKVPAELRALWDRSNVHLIETQRLLRSELTSGPRRPRSERGVSRVSTVMRFSEDATERIQSALSDLGRRSQELDRTFPSRLVKPAAPGTEEPNEDEVRQRYNEQLKLRRRLTRISVLDAFGPDVQLPKKGLEPVVLRVMAEFLIDSEEKFKVVEPLLDRLELLTRILNAKFQYKRIEIDRQQGFVIRTQDETTVRPDQLSSGEQHELVLLYDLLFGASDKALVLIDEPEISLHVNWQKRFLSDLREVSTLTKHRFVVATHSPTIVGRFSDRMVRLEGSE